jgi:hypothetical protein
MRDDLLPFRHDRMIPLVFPREYRFYEFNCNSETTERCAVPRNGEISKVFSVFKTLCCDAEIVITVGAPFPDCPNHKNLPTEWKLIADADPNEYKPNAAGRINLNQKSS